MFGEIGKAFMQGLMHGVAGQLSVPALCLANGWTVDEREGNTCVLYFHDPAGGVRKLSVWDQDGGLAFLLVSNFTFPALPPAVADYLLKRNTQLAQGAWATEGDGQIVGIGLTHRARGLDASQFAQTCVALVNEVLDFDAKLRAAGFGGRS